MKFDPIGSYPKPAQAGGPPIWLGSNSKWIADRVAEYGDGFMPIYGRKGATGIPEIRAACAKRGRNFAAITLALFAPPPKEDLIRESIAEGYTHFVFVIPPESDSVVLSKLDKLAELVQRLRR